ncbi:hypothetical protein ACFLW5_02400 [Chloroflexota bacterium]
MQKKIIGTENNNILRADQITTCPPHYWLINWQDRGVCKKCGATADFKKLLAKLGVWNSAGGHYVKRKVK